MGLGLVLVLGFWLGARPVEAQFTMDGSWGGSCPDCWGASSCLKPDGGYLTQGCYQVPDAECEANGVARPDEVCRTSGPDAWIYTFVLQCQKCTDPYERRCAYRYEYVTKDCSAADRCEDPGIGNIPGACGGGGGDSGSNDTGVILPGICDAPACPGVGCRNGWHYKQRFGRSLAVLNLAIPRPAV